MPSLVSSRKVLEWALRVLSFTILVIIAMRAWDPSSAARHEGSTSGSQLRRALPTWSRANPGEVRLAIDSVPARVDRDWLAALQRAGTRVTWSGHVVPIAATLSQTIDPAGISDLSASAPDGTILELRDDIGVLDTVVAKRGGLNVEIPGIARRITVLGGGQTVVASLRDTAIFKRLLVEGAASWETKFTVAALSERGWKVDALMHVAPSVAVRLGSPAAPDTGRYAAVVAVDTAVPLAEPAVAAFVRNGGGLITLHDAATIGPRASASIVLDRRSSGDVRASRNGAGKVVRIGYGDLWRERMAGDDSVDHTATDHAATDRPSDPVERHRAWLSRIVAAVARVSAAPLPADPEVDPAPLANMVDRIGPSFTRGAETQPSRSEVPSSVLFAVLLASLLAELASRRLRGAR